MGDALPYVTPSEKAVRAGAWTTVQAGGTSSPLPAWLPYWDVSQKLHLARLMEIELGAVYEQSRISTSTRLGLSVVFTSEFEDEVYGTTFEETSGTVQPEIEIEIPGRVLGTTVALTTSVILRDEAQSAEQPVAWRRGSVLWSDLKKIRLYGDVSQFPVNEVDFADCGLDPAAPWFVEIGTELELPAMGAVQLLLNSRFPLVVAAARAATDDDRPELAVVRSELFAAIGRTLIEFALAQDQIEKEWPDDSLGAVLTAALRTHFREPVSDLRKLRDQDPPMWAAKTAAAFGLLREPLR
jgi:hypothetical protein